MNISKYKLIYHILFTKGFYSIWLGGLKELIEYAIYNYAVKRGRGSSNVLYFHMTYLEKITSPQKVNK